MVVGKHRRRRPFRSSSFKTYTSESEHIADLLNKADQLKLDNIRTQIDKEISMATKRFLGDVTMFKAKVDKYNQTMKENADKERSWNPRQGGVFDNSMADEREQRFLGEIEKRQSRKQSDHTKESGLTADITKPPKQKKDTTPFFSRPKQGKKLPQKSKSHQRIVDNRRQTDVSHQYLWNLTTAERRIKIRQIAERKYWEMERREKESERQKMSSDSLTESLGRSELPAMPRISVLKRRDTMRDKAERKYLEMQRQEEIDRLDIGGLDDSVGDEMQHDYVVGQRIDQKKPLPHITQNEWDHGSASPNRFVAEYQQSDLDTSNKRVAEPASDDSLAGDASKESPIIFHRRDSNVCDSSEGEKDTERPEHSPFFALFYDKENLTRAEANHGRTPVKTLLKTRSFPVTTERHMVDNEVNLSQKTLQKYRQRAKEEERRVRDEMLFFMERQDSFNTRYPLPRSHDFYSLQRNKTKVGGMISHAASLREPLKPSKKQLVAGKTGH